MNPVLADCSPNSSLTASVIRNVLSALSTSNYEAALESVEGSPAAFHGVFATAGKSQHMEDSYHVQEQLGSPSLGETQGYTLQDPQHATDDSGTLLTGCTEDLAFFSVFDGHGGDEVAQHCSDRLHQHFTRLLFGHLDSAHVAAGAEAEYCMRSAPSACCTPSKDCVASCAPSCSQPATPTTSTALPGCSSHCTPPPTSRAEAAPCAVSGSKPCRPAVVSAALRSSFHLTDKELAGTEEGEYVGATAVVAVVGRQHIWVAHCGDSRAVMQRNGDAMALTSDHKPDRPDEADRIRAAGGRIVFNGGARRVNGMLAMTRSIGDHYLRPYVIAEPEIVCLERTPEDEVLIIATDGLWDVFACTEATHLASRCISRSLERGMSKHAATVVAASVLANTALERGSRDNITVIVIDLTLPTPGSKAGGDRAGRGEPVVASSVQEEVAAQPSSTVAGDGGEEGHAEAATASSSTSALMRGSTSMGKYVLLKSQSRGEVGGSSGGAAGGAGGASGSGATVGCSPRHVCSAADLTRLCQAADMSDEGTLQGHRPRFADARGGILASDADGRSASTSATGQDSSMTSSLPGQAPVQAVAASSTSGHNSAQLLTLSCGTAGAIGSGGTVVEAAGEVVSPVCSPSRLKQGTGPAGALFSHAPHKPSSTGSSCTAAEGCVEQGDRSVATEVLVDCMAAAVSDPGPVLHAEEDGTGAATLLYRTHAGAIAAAAAPAGAAALLMVDADISPVQRRAVERSSFDEGDFDNEVTAGEAARRLDPLSTGSASHHAVTTHGMSLASGGIRPGHEAGSPSERALSCP